MAVAGSVVQSRRRSYDGIAVKIDWTANAAGAVTEVGTFTGNGYLVEVVYEPGTADNLYDVTLLDSGSKDVLRGLGANQPNAAGNTYDTKYRSNIRDVDGSYFFFIKNLWDTTNFNPINWSIKSHHINCIVFQKQLF